MRLPLERPPDAHTRRADKIGRKPVVLTGIAGIAVGTLFMGFSRSLTGVLFARSLGTPPIFSFARAFR